MYATNSDLNTALTTSGLSLGTISDAQREQALKSGAVRCNLALGASGNVSLPLTAPYCANLVSANVNFAILALISIVGQNFRRLGPSNFKTNLDASSKWLNGVATTGVVA